MGKEAKTQPAVKQDGSGMAKIMGLFTLVILCVFPVVYHNFYFDILETKYQFFSVSAIAMLVVAVVYGLYTNKVIDYFKQFHLKAVMKGLSLVDWAMLAFWLANVISWLLCDWRWEAFWGTSGRYNGVFLMTLYTAAYFMTTRFVKFRRIYLDLFLAVSLFVCLFGISDHFQMDLLGFKEFMMDEQKASYTSTFGNINTYTVYVGAVMVVSTMLFILETCPFRMVYYFVTMAVSMVALIIGASDNAYLTLAALYGLSPLYVFQRWTWIRRYLASMAMFFTAVLFVGWIGVEYQGIVYPVIGIFSILSKMTIIPTVTKALWGIVLVWSLIAFVRRGKGKDEIGKILPILWIGVIIAVLGGVGYVLYDVNVVGNVEKYEAIRKYVVYDDAWGSGRGYVWNRAIELYNEVFTPTQKLFGYGADTFKLLMVQHYPVERGVVFDSVHNEYMNFLLTIGWFGTISFIVLIGAGVVSMAKNLKGRPEVAAMMIMILAYATQALVNINLPVVFPVIWQLFALGLSKAPEKANEEGDKACRQ